MNHLVIFVTILSHIVILNFTKFTDQISEIYFPGNPYIRMKFTLFYFPIVQLFLVLHVLCRPIKSSTLKYQKKKN